MFLKGRAGICDLGAFVIRRLFQNAVSKNAMQFKGNAQHDAQEFLLWLLDRVHEDINTVNSRPSIKVMPITTM